MEDWILEIIRMVMAYAIGFSLGIVFTIYIINRNKKKHLRKTRKGE